MFYQFGACIRTADSNASKYWVRFCPCTATVIASIISTLICLPKRISRLAVYYRARERVGRSERALTPTAHRKNEEVKIAEMHTTQTEEKKKCKQIFIMRAYFAYFSLRLSRSLWCAHISSLRFFFSRSAKFEPTSRTSK